MARVLPPAQRSTWGRGATFAALLAILVLATAVRVWRLDWGLEHRLSFPDEAGFWKSYLFAFQPPRWQSLFGHSLFYPPLYGYLVGLSVAAATALGLIGPARDMFEALLVARGVSVLAGLCSVVLVAIVGARAYGRCVGLLAAALLAAIPFEAMQTHYASVDTLFGTSAALVLLAGCAFTSDRRPLLALATGASVGIAFATKYNALVLAVVPALVLLEVAVTERSWRRVLVLGGATVAGFCGALLVACPPWVFETARVLQQMHWINSMNTVLGWRPPNNHVTPDVGWYGRPYLYHLVASLPFAAGWPLALASLLGIAVALRRHRATDRVILAAVLAYFLLLGQTNVSFSRYLIPLFPALTVLAARALLALPVRLAARGTIAGAIVIYGFALGFSQVDRFSYDQQVGIARWLREAFPRHLHPRPHVVVPQEFQTYFQLHKPLSRVGIRLQTAAPGHWLDDRPEAFVLPEWDAISIRRDAARAAQRADLDQLESGAAGYTEAARWRTTYLQQGFYSWLDPAFAGDLYVGAIGFRVYLRDDLVTRARAPDAGRR